MREESAASTARAPESGTLSAIERMVCGAPVWMVYVTRARLWAGRSSVSMSTAASMYPRLTIAWRSWRAEASVSDGS